MTVLVLQAFNSDSLVLDHELEVHANGPSEQYAIPSIGSLYQEWRGKVLATGLDAGSMYTGAALRPLPGTST